MKTLSLSLAFLVFAGSALAVDKAELDNRIRKLSAKLELLQAQPDKRIPADHLRQAHGIVLLERVKAGFIFGYQGGSGIAMAKDSITGQWSAPAFVEANEASLGFLIGGQKSFVAILLMTPEAVQSLSEAVFEFGGEAGGTAGSSSGKVDGTVSSRDRPVLVYTDRKGLYGGAAIKGDALTPDHEANLACYGRFVSMTDILVERTVEPTEAAAELARKLTEFATETPK